MRERALFEVTRALQQLLRNDLARRHPGAVVTLLPPAAPLPEGPGVNLYLYHVLLPAERHALPAEPFGRPVDRPGDQLHLRYLLTPLARRPDDGGADAGDEAHLMLGLAMEALRTTPVLRGADVPASDAGASSADDQSPAFGQATIALQSAGVDEMARLWESGRAGYRLSVAYEVRVALADGGP